MEEVAKAAKLAITEHDSGIRGIIKFSHCMIPGRHHPVKGFRWVTTDRHATVQFFLACWNNRHALAAMMEGQDHG